jgi:hypothetical protein
MIGNGTPSRQSNAPLPKPMLLSFCLAEGRRPAKFKVPRKSIPIAGELFSVARSEYLVVLEQPKPRSRCPPQQRNSTMAHKRGEQIIETAQEARQAERGPTVRNVLLASMGLAIVALAIIWLVFFRT